MATNALTALNAGSGLDSRALVDGLVGVERSSKSEPINRKLETLNARISALGQLRSALTGIATSLDTRVRSGELGLQLASSDSAISIERIGTGPAGALASGVAVTVLAGGQRLSSAAISGGASAAVGEGTLTIITGRRTPLAPSGFSFAGGAAPSVNINITSANNSLQGLAAAINASDAGITASIIASQGNATLVLRGPEGADNAFIISAAPTGVGPGLERFNHTPGAETLVHGEAARNAELSVDGVAVTRGSNRIDDLIPGARLTLRRPASGMAITAARDGQALSGALADFTGTLQAMRQLIGDFRRPSANGDAPGPLATDATARLLDQRITRLVTAAVPQANGLRLADLGVSVARDGSITVDAARLANLPPTRLGDAEALLREMTGAARADRPNRLQSIAQIAGTASDGLVRQREAATRDLAKVDVQVAALRTLLTRQFSAMDTAVAQSRAVGAQLNQLVDSWFRAEA
ncbi:flagellar filament capping protein FliD [Sandarakinorhabdus sp.]|uniref:flagellar filament capping protein FliD n=1 Tax=Sandarakinorhabdus sp. TaxID=1916663 RepID=UPI003342216D